MFIVDGCDSNDQAASLAMNDEEDAAIWRERYTEMRARCADL